MRHKIGMVRAMLRSTWHTATEIANDTFLIAEPFGAVEPRFGVDTVNMYLVVGQHGTALIDSGTGIGDVSEVVRRLTPLPCIVLNTHSHWDHIGANMRFDNRAVHEIESAQIAIEPDVQGMQEPLRSPSAQAVLPPGYDAAGYRIPAGPATRLLQDGDEIDLGGRSLHIIHTPGHSPGHVAYLDGANGLLFSGDTAYQGPMYACFRGGNPADFAVSTSRLAALPGLQLICPGHNELIRDTSWLAQLAEGVDAALAGQVEGQWRDEFIVGREFQFEGWAIWLPE